MIWDVFINSILSSKYSIRVTCDFSFDSEDREFLVCMCWTELKPAVVPISLKRFPTTFASSGFGRGLSHGPAGCRLGLFLAMTSEAHVPQNGSKHVPGSGGAKGGVQLRFGYSLWHEAWLHGGCTAMIHPGRLPIGNRINGYKLTVKTRKLNLGAFTIHVLFICMCLSHYLIRVSVRRQCLLSHGKEFKVSPPKGSLGSFCSKIFKLYNSRLERIFASTLFPDQFGSVQALIQNWSHLRQVLQGCKRARGLFNS
jgi:hypothetical protein